MLSLIMLCNIITQTETLALTCAHRGTGNTSPLLYVGLVEADLSSLLAEQSALTATLVP